jgi:hypothetical protein
MRRWLLVGGCVGALAAPTAAWGAGGPVPAMQGGPGVGVPDGALNYVAVGIGRRTLVEQVLRPGGGIGRTRLIGGRYGVPGVAYDNATTGLSADGRTLVLAAVLDRFPVRRTRLVVLDARRLRVVRRIALPGWYTVDAIAPDGRALYLIHYLRQDAARYEVRALDLAAGRLVPAPVVDPREPGEKMQGLPMTRATSADGRFAYTLYERPQGAPFIHALDTVRGSAACIDLPSLSGADLSAARLTPPAAGRPLLVRGAGIAPLAVDVAARRARTETFGPAAAAAAPVPVATPDPGRDTVAGLAGGLAALAAAAAAAGALATVVRRRRGSRGRRAAPPGAAA